MTKDGDRVFLNLNEDFEAYLGFERKTIENRKKKVFACCRFLEEVITRRRYFLKNREKKKTSKAKCKIN